MTHCLHIFKAKAESTCCGSFQPADICFFLLSRGKRSRTWISDCGHKNAFFDALPWLMLSPEEMLNKGLEWQSFKMAWLVVVQSWQLAHREIYLVSRTLQIFSFALSHKYTNTQIQIYKYTNAKMKIRK
jgi:hypothetical protein